MFNSKIAPVEDSANSADSKEDRCSHFAVSINNIGGGMLTRVTEGLSKKSFLDAGYNDDQATFLQSEHCGLSLSNPS